MSNPPAEKKRKADDSGDTMSWRAKSIEKFGLQPVPDAWKDSVAIGSEEGWNRYYEFRSKSEQEDRDKMTDKNFEEEGSLDYMKEWKAEMAKRVDESMAGDCKWHWTPAFGHLGWDEDARLIGATYFANVWSPFAIPHAINLSHNYHHSMRYGGIEFGTYWEYRLVDFEDEETVKSKEHTELCKSYEDADIQEEGIDTTNLSKSTYKTLRKFLFGTCSEDSEEVTCSDMNFWLLFFGSMGCTDCNFGGDIKGGGFGYSWSPDKEMRKKLYDQKAKEGDADPNGPFDEYYPDRCSWLKHRVLEITDKIGPVTKHYEQPKPKFRRRTPAENAFLALAYGGDY
mmetsp:Transcript_8400/g.18824  ORF Transcript_8400/g.18824 Transcript_8400/m.18824 type:complete len:340 (-) Transcript_8400:64-1083(-)